MPQVIRIAVDRTFVVGDELPESEAIPVSQFVSIRLYGRMRAKNLTATLTIVPQTAARAGAPDEMSSYSTTGISGRFVDEAPSPALSFATGDTVPCSKAVVIDKPGAWLKFKVTGTGTDRVTGDLWAVGYER